MNFWLRLKNIFSKESAIVEDTVEVRRLKLNQKELKLLAMIEGCHLRIKDYTMAIEDKSVPMTQEKEEKLKIFIGNEYRTIEFLKKKIEKLKKEMI